MTPTIVAPTPTVHDYYLIRHVYPCLRVRQLSMPERHHKVIGRVLGTRASQVARHLLLR
jgi:hypothetical protein